MKRIFLVLIAIAFSLGLNAQTKYADYEMSYFDYIDDGIFDIKIDSETRDLYIIIASAESSTDYCGININDNSEFRSYLQALKSQYEEWTAIAKENNVTELRKDHTMKPQKIRSAYWRSSDFWFDFNVKLEADFMITEGKYLTIIRTGELTSSSNQYIDYDGGYLVFSSPTEFDNIINAISDETINTALNKENSKDSLFK